jgi:UPF0716 protein FxsA
MCLKLLILFTVVPALELYLLLVLTDATSIGVTIGVILGTGVLGTWLARQQGMRTLSRMNARLRQGEVPGRQMLDGLFILIAGALLMTPGLLTDALGFILLIPWTRAIVRRGARAHIKRKIDEGTLHVHGFSGGWRPISKEPPPGSPPLEDEE